MQILIQNLYLETDILIQNLYLKFKQKFTIKGPECKNCSTFVPKVPCFLQRS